MILKAALGLVAWIVIGLIVALAFGRYIGED